MSFPKRGIDIDPETPVSTLTELLATSNDEIEFRIGAQLFVVHRRNDEAAKEGELSVARPEMDATGRLLAVAGAWKDLIDGAALKRSIYDMRDVETELERTRRTFSIS